MILEAITNKYMVSGGHIQTLLPCAKAQERCAMLPDGFSIGYIQPGMRLRLTLLYINLPSVGVQNNIAVTNLKAISLSVKLRGSWKLVISDTRIVANRSYMNDIIIPWRPIVKAAFVCLGQNSLSGYC